MSSKARRNGNTEPQANSSPETGNHETSNLETVEFSAGDSARDEEIRLRAYEIYIERGEQPGQELDDWLQAERELGRVLVLRAHAG